MAFGTGLLSISVVLFRSFLFPQVKTPQAVILAIVSALAASVAACVVIVLTSDSVFYASNETFRLCDRLLHCNFSIKN